VDAFVAKVAARVIVTRKEMDEAANKQREEDDGEDAVNLNSIPREQRLGLGGLDSFEVFKTLPLSMQEALSRMRCNGFICKNALMLVCGIRVVEKKKRRKVILNYDLKKYISKK